VDRLALKAMRERIAEGAVLHCTLLADIDYDNQAAEPRRLPTRST